MSTATTHPSRPEDFVGYDRLCVRCRYNLVGLVRTSACPECGLPVLDSLGGRAFFRVSGPYLRRIASGALWLEIAYVGLWIGHCIPALALVMLVAAGAGWLRLGARPPETGGSREVGRWAARVRLWSVVAVVAAVATIPLLFASFLGASRSGPFPWQLRVGALGAVAFGASAMAFCGCGLASELLVRLPDIGMARTARLLKWPALLWGPSLSALATAMVAADAPILAGRGAPLLLTTGLLGWMITTLLMAVVSRLASELRDEAALIPDPHP